MKTRSLALFALLSAAPVFALACADDTTDADLPAVTDAGKKDSGTTKDAGKDSGSTTTDAGTDATVDTDSGAIDAGTPDTGTVVDAGATDAGAVDAGAIDAGPRDAGAVDAGPVDAGGGGANPVKPVAGELLISEILYKGVAGAETDFEWIEVYNPTAKRLDLGGTVVGYSTTASNLPAVLSWSEAIPAGTVIEPGQYRVIANKAATCRVPDAAFLKSAAGAVRYATDANSASRGLGNTNVNSRIVLRDSALAAGFVTFDDVSYGGFVNGAGALATLNQQSIQRKDFTLPTAEAKWCKSGNDWAGGNAGDKGTPGAAHDCP